MEFDPHQLRRRLRSALGAYAAIAGLAAFTLEGALLWIVLLFLAALAVRSWVAVRREELG